MLTNQDTHKKLDDYIFTLQTKLKSYHPRVQFDAWMALWQGSPLVCMVHVALGAERYWDDDVMQSAINELYDHGIGTLHFTSKRHDLIRELENVIEFCQELTEE